MYEYKSLKCFIRRALYKNILADKSTTDYDFISSDQSNIEFLDQKNEMLYYWTMHGPKDHRLRLEYPCTLMDDMDLKRTSSALPKGNPTAFSTSKRMIDQPIIIAEKLLMSNIEEKSIYDQMIEVIPFIDPDTTRMVEWIWARRIKKNLDSCSRSITEPLDSKIDFEVLQSLIKQYVDHDYNSIKFFRGVKIDQTNNVIQLYVVAEQNNSNNIIHIFGDSKLVLELYDKARKLFVTNKSIIVDTLMGFNSHGAVNHEVKLVHSEQKFPTNEFYPWLEEGIDAFVENYKKSASSVLVLIGAPGTGKTSFLRMLMFKLQMENIGLVTSDNASLDPTLPQWLLEKGNNSLIAFEDADNLVACRKDGNTQMSAILNYAEGVISSNIKLIISTNLSSTNKVDPALIRPGRAYRVLTFGELTVEQANNARKSIGLPAIEFHKDKKYTLSEALNYAGEHDLSVREHNSMGFIGK